MRASSKNRRSNSRAAPDAAATEASIVFKATVRARVGSAGLVDDAHAAAADLADDLVTADGFRRCGLRHPKGRS